MTNNMASNRVVNRILVVGLGSIGSRHVRIMHELYPNIDVAVLRHQGCADEKVESLGIKRCFAAIEDALEFKPDAALIANPASMHLDVALPLAQAGIHLLVEKPISDTIDGVSQLITACRERNVRLMVGYNLRFLTSLVAFKELLEQNKVGSVLSVRAEVGQYLPDWRPGTDYRNTVSAQKCLGGGVLLELSHEIDYLLWLFGSVQWVKASLLRQSDMEIDVEDTAHLQFGFEKDGSGRQLVAALDMDFVRRDSTRRCIVIGEGGTLCWDGITGKVELMPTGANAWEELVSDQAERDFTYREELKHFIASIENGVDPLISGEDGKAVLSVVEAARHSNTNGQVVYL